MTSDDTDARHGRHAAGPAGGPPPADDTAPDPELLEAQPEAATGSDEVTNRKNTFSGGLWNAAATVLPMASTLALSIVISRELGADVLGQQSVVAYVASTLVSVLIFSFTTASIQLLAASVGARDEGRLAWLGRWSSGAHLVGGTVTAAVLVSVGLARSEYQALWYLAAATAFVDALGWARASRDIARRGWTRTSRLRLVAQAASPLMAIGAVYAGLGVQGVFTAQLVVAIALLIALDRLGRATPWPAVRAEHRPEWKPVLRLWSLFTLSLLITQIVERRLELVFLDQFHDSRTVAMYSVAFNVVAIPTTVTGALIHAALPAIAARFSQDPAAVTATLGRAARVVVTTGIVLAAATVSVGPGLVTTAYGSEFTPAAGLVRILGLTLLVVPLGQICTALWTGTGRLKPVLVAGGTAAVVDVVLAFLLIPPFATTGAMITTFAAQTSSAVVIVGYTLRNDIRLNLRPGRLLVAVAVAVLAAVAATITKDHVGGVLGDLAAGTVFLLVVALGSRTVGVFDRSDLDWLGGTLPGPARRALQLLSR